MTTENALVGGRYRLDQPVGRGRAGIVWQGFDTRLHRTVAAKRLYVPSAADPARTESAIGEAVAQAQNAARITHPNVVSQREVVRDGQYAWLVMEYVPSRRMSEFLAEHGSLTANQAASLGSQVAAGLAAAHATGVAHRAVEPGNILLADDGGVKVTDVGIVGAGADRAFTAPEGDGSPAADVYSLGATLYFAVEGEPPFGQDGTGQLRPPANAGTLERLLRQLLAADPAARPAMADLSGALSAVADGGPVPALQPAGPSNFAPQAATVALTRSEPPAEPPPSTPAAGNAFAATVSNPQPSNPQPSNPQPSNPPAPTQVTQPVQVPPTMRVPATPPPTPQWPTGPQPTLVGAQPQQPPPNPYEHQTMPVHGRPAYAQQPMPPQPRYGMDQRATANADSSSQLRAWVFVIIAVLVAAGFGILFTELVLL